MIKYILIPLCLKNEISWNCEHTPHWCRWYDFGQVDVLIIASSAKLKRVRKHAITPNQSGGANPPLACAPKASSNQEVYRGTHLPHSRRASVALGAGARPALVRRRRSPRPPPAHCVIVRCAVRVACDAAAECNALLLIFCCSAICPIRWVQTRRVEPLRRVHRVPQPLRPGNAPAPSRVAAPRGPLRWVPFQRPAPPSAVAPREPAGSIVDCVRCDVERIHRAGNRR